MHLEMNWITYAWVIEGAVLALLIYGVIKYFNYSSYIGDGFKKPLFLILFALTINIFLGVFVGILVTIQVSYESAIWVIHPLLGLLSTMLLVKSSNQISKEVRRK